MSNITDMIVYLKWTSQVEINNFDVVLNYNQIQGKKIYTLFVGLKKRNLKDVVMMI